MRIPDYFRTVIAAHAHTGGASLVTHPPILVMAIGSLIVGVIITALTSLASRS